MPQLNFDTDTDETMSEGFSLYENNDPADSIDAARLLDGLSLDTEE